MNIISKYFQELTQDVGQAWNRFWFTPADPAIAGMARLVIGFLGTLYLIQFTGELVTWFGDDGLLSMSILEKITGAGEQTLYRFSAFYFLRTPALIWIFHFLSIGILLALTVGWMSRVTSVLSLLVILSYVHRAPMLAGQWEPVLTMLLAYLCIAPSGSFFSIDSRLKSRKSDKGVSAPDVHLSTTANLSIRLMQVHLIGFYIVMALSKTSGVAWWGGQAVWTLVATTAGPLVDLTFLYDNPLYLLNLWTHAIVVFEFLYPLLIWNDRMRPLLIAISVIMWGSLAAITGLVGFALTMILINVVFVKASSLRACTTRFSV